MGEVYQRVTGLTNGTYTLSVSYQSGNVANTNGAYIYADPDAKEASRIKANIKATNNWEKVTISNIKVTNGTVAVGIYADAKESYWASFDDVTLTLQPAVSDITITETLPTGVTASYEYTPQGGTAQTATNKKFPNTAASLTVTLTGFDANKHTASYKIGSGTAVAITGSPVTIDKPSGGWDAVTIEVKDKAKAEGGCSELLF